MAILFMLLNMLLSLYELALFIYVVMSWLRPAANRWTELLRRIVEPVLMPVRRFLVAKLPSRWQMMDWSPLAVWLLIGIARRVLSLVLGVFLW